MPAQQAEAARGARQSSLLCFKVRLLTAKVVVSASLRQLTLLPASAARQEISPFRLMQSAAHAAWGIRQHPKPLPAQPVERASLRPRLLRHAPDALAESTPARQAKAARSAKLGNLLCSMAELLTAKSVFAAG